MRLMKHRPNIVLSSTLIVVGIALLAILLVPGAASPVQASSDIQPMVAPAPNNLADNTACLACHGQSNQYGTFPNRAQYSITVLKDLYAVSTHASLECTKCHQGLKDAPPHRDLKAFKIDNDRDYAISYKDTCKECHAKPSAELQDSMHTKFLVELGFWNTPVCNDCHNPHTETKHKDAQGVLLPQARADIPKTCSKCHDAIYQAYAKSVHGKGVLSTNNQDVPTCTDCHGVHTIVDARTAAFRNSSIELCANCHTNEKLMSKYGLPTGVMNTYVADFHGTTVTLFERQTPDQPTNKPVCYDCHGVHEILRADDPNKGLQVRTNLLKTCQRCHPDANENFDTSWLSHYIPSPTKYPLVYYINLIYLILIPTVLGGMALIIATDVFHKVRTRGKPTHHEETTSKSEDKPGEPMLTKPTTGKEE